MMPFIGVIVSPYDTRLSSASSSITMFYVEPTISVSSCGTPMRCIYCTSALPPPSGNQLLLQPSAASPAAAAAPESDGLHGSQPSKAQRTCATSADVANGTQVSERYWGHYWDRQLRSTVRVLCALVHYYKENRSRTQLQARRPRRRTQELARQ